MKGLVLRSLWSRFALGRGYGKVVERFTNVRVKFDCVEGFIILYYAIFQLILIFH